MRNFVFVSCNYPRNYFHFTQSLKEVGFNVLGIGDELYSVLSKELKVSLTEYLYVSDMRDFKKMKEAVGYYEKKYGKIEFIESNNEYWLEQDARLRSEFNITTGKNSSNIEYFKFKSKEKEIYKKANVKVGRFHLLKTKEEALNFISEVKYPIIAKPDNGVGGHSTYKISSLEEFLHFYETYDKKIQYLLEEFINGELISFDGVTSKEAKVLFCSNEVFPDHLKCVKEDRVDIFYYGNKQIPQDLKEAGERVLKAFEASYRYFHLEFLRLIEDKEGLGKKGDLIGLEANMRAPGGFTPDVINWVSGVNSYQIWANVMGTNSFIDKEIHKRYYSMYVGRRNKQAYELEDKEIEEKFQRELVQKGEIPLGLQDDLGDYFFIARFDDLDKGKEFISLLTKRKQKEKSISIH